MIFYSSHYTPQFCRIQLWRHRATLKHSLRFCFRPLCIKNTTLTMLHFYLPYMEWCQYRQLAVCDLSISCLQKKPVFWVAIQTIWVPCSAVEDVAEVERCSPTDSWKDWRKSECCLTKCVNLLPIWIKIAINLIKLFATAATSGCNQFLTSSWAWAQEWYIARLSFS